MRRYLGIGAAWLGATVLSVLIASAAVAGIRDRVVETPVAIGAPTTSTTVAPVVTTSSASSTTSATTTTAPPTTVATTQAPTGTTTTVADSTTTTAPPATATTTTTTTTTTAPPQTTTTVAMTNQTFNLIGGSVTLSVGNGEVWVVSAVPSAGFDVDIEHAGPTEVEVKFRSNDHESELSAHMDNGELKVETEEEPRDGEED